MHRAPWPAGDVLHAAADGADPAVLEVAASVLAEVRKAKTTDKRSLRTPVLRLVVHDDAVRLGALRAAERDVRDAGFVTDLVVREAAERSVTVELAPAG